LLNHQAYLLRGMVGLLLAIIFAVTASAQTPATLPAAEKPKVEEKTPQPPEAVSVHFQASVVGQGHPGFHAAYSGPLSLYRYAEFRETYSSTLFLGAHLWEGGEAYVNPEMTAGLGIGRGSGVAGYTTAEINRSPHTEPGVYLARAFYRQTIGFGGEKENVAGDQNQLAANYDISRLTITLGKINSADQFDSNAFSHDPRTQYLNWALVQNAAWDAPAELHGYTYGGTVELNQPKYAVRYGVFMEPSRASASRFDYHIGRALGQVAEFEQRYEIDKHAGKIRVLGFLNHANMGSFGRGADLPVPDVTRVRRYAIKYGFGINLEQQITDDLGLFARLGWNDGLHEDISYTEADRTVSVGLSLKGTRWARPDDTVGIAGVLDGLSNSHRRYLAAGGIGFIIGDGRLSYDLEEIAETYYSAKIFKNVFLSADIQLVNHPAYNRDRGPVVVGALRLHVQF
jgi:high affinity Mn2+ porin